MSSGAKTSVRSQKVLEAPATVEFPKMERSGKFNFWAALGLGT
ncbi:MAG: hypothetical protein ACMG6E_10835 [Candidatus Roizmanbacteria bacterium]